MGGDPSKEMTSSHLWVLHPFLLIRMNGLFCTKETVRKIFAKSMPRHNCSNRKERSRDRRKSGSDRALRDFVASSSPLKMGSGHQKDAYFGVSLFQVFFRTDTTWLNLRGWNPGNNNMALYAFFASDVENLLNVNRPDATCATVASEGGTPPATEFHTVFEKRYCTSKLRGILLNKSRCRQVAFFVVPKLT